MTDERQVADYVRLFGAVRSMCVAADELERRLIEAFIEERATDTANQGPA